MTVRAVVILAECAFSLLLCTGCGGGFGSEGDCERLLAPSVFGEESLTVDVEPPDE